MKSKRVSIILILLITFPTFFFFQPELAVHATSSVTIYSYDVCTSADTWVPVKCALAVDHTVFAQGDSSIQFSNATLDGYNHVVSSTQLTTFSPTKSHTSIGWWLRIDPNTPSATWYGLYCEIKDPNGTTRMNLAVYYNSGWRYYYQVRELDGSSSDGNTYGTHPYTKGDWVWLEVDWVNASYVTFYANGTSLMHYGSSYNIPLYNTNDDAVPSIDWYFAKGWYELDYARVANDMEFPPSEPPIMIHMDLDGNNIDGTGTWVFTDWKYYTFTATIPYSGNLTELVIYFDVNLGIRNNVHCGFYANNDSQWLAATDLTGEEINRFGQPVLLKDGVWETTATNYTVTFPIWFNDQCLDIYDNAVDVYAWANFSDIGETSYGLADGGEDLFFIYSKGGFTKDSYNSDPNYCGKIVGEEWAALFGWNGTLCNNTIWFRDLQHIKMLPEVQFFAGLEDFWIRTRVEYSIGEGEWLQGWQSIIHVSYVSYTGIYAGNVWINMTINWYQGNHLTDDYDMMKTNDVYMFYHGIVSQAGDVGRWRFWIDEWFNNINASSTGGGRINAYEFPMVDNTAAWLRWLSSTWGVKDDVEKESMFMTDLTDSAGNIMSSERISMVRIIQELEVGNADAGQEVLLHNYDVMDYTKSPDFPLTGTQTPVFDETKVPTVGNTGLLGAIFSMFSGIAQWISENILFGGLNLWGTFVAFLDTIAGWLGMPSGFSNLIAWLGTGWGWLVSSFTYALTIIYDIFLMLASVMGSLIWMLGQAIVSFASVIGMIAGFLAGTFGGAGDLWTQLGLSTWITVAIIFYPLYLIILWDQKGMDAVISQLSMIWGIMSWLAHFFISIIQTVITILSGIIESIPVVE